MAEATENMVVIDENNPLELMLDELRKWHSAGGDPDELEQRVAALEEKFNISRERIQEILGELIGTGGSAGGLVRRALIEGVDYTQAASDYIQNLNVPETEMTTGSFSMGYDVSNGEDSYNQVAADDATFSGKYTWISREPHVSGFDDYDFSKLNPSSVEISIGGTGMSSASSWAPVVSVADAESIDGRTAKTIIADVTTDKGSVIRLTFSNCVIDGSGYCSCDITASVADWAQDDTARINSAQIRFALAAFMYPNIRGVTVAVTLTKSITALTDFSCKMQYMQPDDGDYGYPDSERTASLAPFFGMVDRTIMMTIDDLSVALEDQDNLVLFAWVEFEDDLHFSITILHDEDNSYIPGAKDPKIIELIQTGASA